MRTKSIVCLSRQPIRYVFTIVYTITIIHAYSLPTPVQPPPPLLSTVLCHAYFMYWLMDIILTSTVIESSHSFATCVTFHGRMKIFRIND